MTWASKTEDCLACPKPGKLKFLLFSSPVWNFCASQTSFHRETIGGIMKCLLFSETLALFCNQKTVIFVLFFPLKSPSPWSVVALLTLVCQTVYDVQGIFRCMTNSTSCLVQDILECFYCLASVFYYLESQHRIGSG